MNRQWIVLASALLLSACMSSEPIRFDYGEQSPDLSDDDNDGVVNERDMCGGTIAGTRVAHDGCAFWEQVEEVKEAVVLFGFDSDHVRVEHFQEIKDVVSYVAAHPNAFILVEGHSSAVGDEEYNQKLQARRAASIKELLLQEGAAPDKLRIKEQGSVTPRVDQDEVVSADAVNQRVYIRAVRSVESREKKWTIYSSDEQ